jgi:Zn-dependent protease
MQASETDIIFYVIVLLMSVVIHEVSHGFMAEYWGDSTARHAGRLTLNPIVHLDLFGSIIIPALLVISGAPIFGWAKPVPYNPDNLRDKKWGTIAVASAGVLANLLIALIFGLMIRFVPFLVPIKFYTITSTIVLVNLALAIFNLVPIPPLDGSKILFSLLPQSWSRALMFIEQYSLFLLVIFVVAFARFLQPILVFLFHLFTGLPI